MDKIYRILISIINLQINQKELIQNINQYQRSLISKKKEYLLNLIRWPDDNQVLIEIDKFNLFQYIKFLFKSKFDYQEEKDQFPYRAFQAILLFIVIEILLNLYYYTCKDYYQEYQREDIKPHYNYKTLENKLRYSILLFKRLAN
ncbi:unnamed protein product [Paramecium pentaurelia]|uniref:Transmembrane protein n=1 Tax=Paramecium pentaurelia TaxID=43138 RepID=A0A8S1SZ82_9CILI|nr:unnamed protein product [Paramecium pentaurelia]